MDERTPYTPVTPPPGQPCPDPLTQVVTVADLAERLGLTPAAVRQALHVGASWLPRPDGRINGGLVWRASTLEGIEHVERPAPGRPKRTTSPAPVARPTVNEPVDHAAPPPAPVDRPVDDGDAGWWDGEE